MPLAKTRREGPGLVAPGLWRRLVAVWMKHLGSLGPPETGLAIYGEVGIRMHRDASDARPICMNVNMGRASWFHNRDRHGPQDYPVPRERCVDLVGGEVLVFDCKHPHGCVPNPSGDRWTVVLWQVK